MDSNIRYVALVFNPRIFPLIEEQNKFELSNDIFISNSFHQFGLDQDAIDRWYGYIGENTWTDLKSFPYALIQIASEEAPDNQHLLKNVQSTLWSLLLVESFPDLADKGFIITGMGQKTDNNRFCFKTIDSFTTFSGWRRGYFWGDFDDENWKNEFNNYVQENVNNNSFLEKWQRVYQEIWSKIWNDWAQYEQCYFALFSYKNAFKADWLEFRIPDFVRSIECIIGLQKGKGARYFSKRVAEILRIQNNVDIPSFLNNGDLRSELEVLYQLRNDCVHGKRFAFSLKEQWQNTNAAEEDFKEKIIKLDFLAEFCARTIIIFSWMNPVLKADCVNREALEEAWEEEDAYLTQLENA